MIKTPEEAKEVVRTIKDSFDVNESPESKKIFDNLQDNLEGKKKTINKSSSAKEGDILELKTTAGFAYAQYTHFHPECGELMRVLQGFYRKRLSQTGVDVIAQKKHRFSLFIDWDYCIGSKITRYVGNFPISDYVKDFPIFKKTNALMDQFWNDPNSVIWRFWDGEKEWEASTLDEEEIKKHPEVIMCTSEVTFEHYIRTGKSLGEDLY
jgi:hypothetical protein